MTAEEVSPGRYDDLSHRIKEMLQKGLPEHKHEADALYKSEEGYRLLAASVDSMYLVDSECRYLFMNEGYRRRVGLPLEDIIGRRYGDFHSEEDSRNFAEKVKEVIETGKATYQERWSERDGGYFLRTFTPAMGNSPSGEVTKVIVVSKEITKRKRFEEELKQHRDHLAQRVRERTVELQTTNEQLRQEITERKHTEEALKRIEWMLTAGKQDSKDLKKTRTNPPYGDLTKLNTTRLIFDSVGEEILGDIARDYLDLLETSVAIYEKNGDYALDILSSSWCQFLDCASRKLCHTEDNREALNSGKWLCHEFCWTNASKVAVETGQPTDIVCNGGIHIYAIPVWASGEVVGSINIGYGNPPKEPDELQRLAEEYAVDAAELMEMAKSYESRPSFIINLAKERLQSSAKLIGTMIERKQADDNIRTLNEEMKICLQELTVARVLEEKANRAKAEFLANISHELTTPLNSIIGFSQVLLTKNFGDLNEKQRGYVENILNAGERLHDTLKNIVSFVRMDVSDPEMDWQEFRLKDIVDSSLSVFRKAATDRHLTLTLDMATEADRMIRADRGKLIQVFHNLISNAMKFSREGGQITLGVRYRKGSGESGKDDFIEITVEDTGIGIKEEDMPLLFRPFHQLEAPLTKLFAGVGMGLVLARKLIEAHGGAIRVESDYGKGSKFIFTIPVNDGQKNDQKGSQP